MAPSLRGAIRRGPAPPDAPPGRPAGASRCSRLPAALSLVLVALAPLPGDAGELTRFAQKLARLRGEVEQLSTGLQLKKDELRGKIRSLSARKAELELELQRAEIRLKQLRAARARRVQQVEKSARRSERLRPVARRAIARVRAATRSTLPFKTGERLAALDALERRMRDKVITPEAAVAGLWGIVGDELRLSRENGIYRQLVRLGGKKVLADVARVGMVMLFFRTPDERYGMAVRRGDTWRYEQLFEPDQVEQVQRLFDAFKKQIRTGYFVLPGAPGGAS